MILTWRPTITTTLSSRLKPWDYTYYTWGDAPDTWWSANQTWWTYWFWMPATVLTWRLTVSTTLTWRVIPT